MIQVVVELVAVQGVGAINFITASNASTEAFKTANLLKSLSLNALIIGDRGVGKLTLAQYIMPQAAIVDASDNDKLFQLLDSSSEIIITHLENSSNLQLLLNKIEQSNVRILSTCSGNVDYQQLDKIFSMKIELPPLSERYEDVEALSKSFRNECHKLFNIDSESLTNKLENFKPDLSLNSHSLKKQIYFHSIVNNINENELMQLMENYLHDKLGSNSDYSKFLPLFEVPLIRAGLKRFKSQLQLSDRLGLNRNTLRKKIQENKEYLNE